MTAQERLTSALVHLAADGGRPPCGDFGGHALWTSDDSADRALAARWCQSCPLIRECHDAAEERGERYHVWGGVDRTADRKLTNTTQMRSPP